METVSIDYGWLAFCMVLAGWLGFELIGKIPSQLHTPLMSGTNAISGITLVGALAALSYATDMIAEVFCYVAIFFTVIIGVGGCWFTDRMFLMFLKYQLNVSSVMY